MANFFWGVSWLLGCLHILLNRLLMHLNRIVTLSTKKNEEKSLIFSESQAFFRTSNQKHVIHSLYYTLHYHT
jgi:hypothetical protein